MNSDTGAMKIENPLRQIQEQFKKFKFTVAVKNIIYHFITRERRCSFGDKNPDKTVYIIRSINEKSPFYIGAVQNLLANYFYVLSHIQYARTRGWIPVVDQLNYPVYNSRKEPINGTMNAWEYFWQQPGGISLDEAYQSRNVVLSKQSWFWQWDMGYDSEKYRNEQIIDEFSRLTSSIPLNNEMETFVAAAKEAAFSNRRNVLGVNVRITGHSQKSAIHGNGHPVQPELDELLQLVKCKMDLWGMEYVFLASDTEFAAKRFREEFGEKLILYVRERAEIGKEYERDYKKHMYAPEMMYQTARDYLTEMELLSCCDALIGSITSGLRYALIKNGNAFAHVEIIEKGFFRDDRYRNGCGCGNG